jgi:tetratricopeptide (TPR) repeat protein
LIMSTAAISPTRPQWFTHPAVDLLIGCGMWSLPLMALTTWLNTAFAAGLALSFYIISFFCNYPHYMATIYRAYGTRQDFNKYKFFTVYISVFMLLTAAVTHGSHKLFGGAVNLVPFFVTFYLTWSPYHYMGQNFGLTMMFARRNGATPPSWARHLLRLSFLGSYGLMFLAIHSGQNGVPNMVSLGIPHQLSIPLRFVSMAVFLLAGIPALTVLVRQVGARRMVGSIALFCTQGIWFVLPAVYELFLGTKPPPVYYSTGILAFMHCAQYLWITGYFTKRETESGMRGSGKWRPLAYYSTLMLGGVALFIPGPWLVSRVFHYDLAESVLIFSALINIHHFMLDGAIWKLRDGRIAALLLGSNKPGADPDGSVSDYFTGFFRWLMGATISGRVTRYVAATALLAIASLDITYAYLTREGASMKQIELAQKINPFDTAASYRKANMLADSGEMERAMDELRRAIAINPYAASVQRLLPLLVAREGMRLKDMRLLREADQGFAYLPMLFRPDFSTLVNWGIVAVTLGQEEEGIERLEKGVELEPTDPQARLYLGDAYLMRADYENASTQFAAYLDITGPTAMDSPENIAENIAAAMKMGDALAGMGKTQESLFWFQRVVENSLKLRQFELASQAFARAGEVQEQSGFLHEAAGLFRSGISVAEDSGYEEPQGRAWYHYAKFLRRQRAKDELVLAASLRCETMLRATLSDSLDSATVLRREVERVLGEEGSTLVRGDLDNYCDQARLWEPGIVTASAALAPR